MAQSNDGSQGQPGGRGAPTRRKPRRRTVLNLGVPFLQIDDFVNQSEDAVAVGYRVLVETVKEIQDGYEEAKKFYALDKAYRDGDSPTPPPIPWTQMVNRLLNIQNIGLQAAERGTHILIDSVKTGMASTERMAEVWQKSREDIEANPVLAGPVFEERINVTTKIGETPQVPPMKIRHRGLMRLRINAVVDPRPKRLAPEGTSEADRAFKGSITVSFDPSSDPSEIRQDISILKVVFGQVPPQEAGVYDGIIRASNFELLIARLRITVEEAAPTTRQSRARTAPPAPPRASRAPKKR